MKLFATDLDGTLLNSSHELSKENVEALKLAQQNGIEVSIATGRTYCDALHICKKAGLNTHIISSNGASVFSNTGEKLKASAIDKKYLEDVFDWLIENEFCYEVCTDNVLFLPYNTEALLKNDFAKAKISDPSLSEDALNDMVSLIFSQAGIRLARCKDDILNSGLDFCSITGLSFSKDKLNYGRKYCENFSELSMVVSNEYNFELTNKNASKGNSLEHLSKHLGVSLNDVAAIGDNYNDISMFKKAGISIAMGNAADDIKKICRHISLSNDLNGVAHIIYKLMNKLKVESTPA